MKPILEIKNISKKFRIRHEQLPYLSLRDSLTQLFRPGTGSTEEFYALKEVSFDVYPGDSIGIIGKNGAGKSTLLKILSRITPPTSGKIIARGRIASLLEVGTGFHPELTGRENIFLNGSILGMKKKEIIHKFDEIIEFSGTEKFLDTPLKHYSSGMQLRLAFSVAAFLEPEILVIDEVLAVGDAEFQKKCIGKIENISKSGRTILFVSHNMTAINSLCPKSIYLKNGQVVKISNSIDTISTYLSTERLHSVERRWVEKNPGDDIAILHFARLIDTNHKSIQFSPIDETTGIEFIYEILKEGFEPVPNIHIFTSSGEYAFVSSEKSNQHLTKKGTYKSVMWIPGNLLNAGLYSVGIALSDLTPLNIHFFEKDAIVFEIIEDVTKRGINYTEKIPGVFRPSLNWDSFKIS